MRGSSVLATARPSLAVLALAAVTVVGATWCPAAALAATKHAAGLSEAPFAYNTSGVVGIGADPSSVVGPAVLQFQGLTGASYDPAYGQAISLGQFVVNPASTTGGTTTTYNATPFEVEIQAPGLDKTSTVPVLGKLFPTLGKSLSLKTVNENSLLLKGTLTGTVSPTGQANVVATVDSVKLGSMDKSTTDHITHYTFPIRFSQLKLPTSWVMAGTTVPTSSTLSLTAVQAPLAAPTAVATPAATTLAGTPEAQMIAAIAPATLPTAAAAIAPSPSAESGVVGTPHSDARALDDPRLRDGLRRPRPRPSPPGPVGPPGRLIWPDGTDRPDLHEIIATGPGGHQGRPVPRRSRPRPSINPAQHSPSSFHPRPGSRVRSFQKSQFNFP